MSQKKSKQLRRMMIGNTKMTTKGIQRLAALSNIPRENLFAFIRKPFRARNIIRFMDNAHLVKYPMPPYAKDMLGKIQIENGLPVTKAWAATWVLPT